MRERAQQARRAREPFTSCPRATHRIEREVEFAPGAEREVYHAVSQQDYIAIVAALPDNRFPIVRQYRPALESFTWNWRRPGKTEDAAPGIDRNIAGLHSQLQKKRPAQASGEPCDDLPCPLLPILYHSTSKVPVSRGPRRLHSLRL